MPNPKKTRLKCPICGKEPAYSYYKYCSNFCQHEYEYRQYINNWKDGVIKGITSIGTVSNPIKRYLREKFEDKCCICGWSEINPRTGTVPVVADHIDGNWQNNSEENLRLLCPNCDSLTETYSGLNRGKGRKGRVVSKRILDARQMNDYYYIEE